MQVVVQVAILYLLIRGGFFYRDDILNLRLAQVSPLDPNYLMIPNFQHLEPGVRLEYWIVDHVIGLHYQIVAAIVAILIGVTTWVTYRVQRLLFSPSLWMLGLSLLFGLWIGWMGAAPWLASAFEVVPSTLASAIAIYAFCRRLNGGGDLWIAITGVAFAGGLAFYEGTMVMIPALMLIVVAYGLERSSTPDWHRLIRLAAAPLAWCIIAAAAFIAVFISKVPLPVSHLPAPSSLLGFLVNSWSISFVPGLFGGPVDWQWTGPHGSGAAPLLLAIGCQLLLLALVIGTAWRTKGRALAGWALVLIPFVLLVGLVGWARMHEFGIGIGQNYQYATNALAPALVGLMFVAMGRPEPSGQLAMGHLGSKTIASALLCSYLALFWVSALPAASRWSDSPARPYLTNLRASVQALSEMDPNEWSLYDTAVPAAVLFTSAWPYNSVSDFSNVFGVKIRVDVAGDRQFVVNAEGTARRAELEIEWTVSDVCSSRGDYIDARVTPELAPGVWTLDMLMSGHSGRSVAIADSSSSLRALSATVASARLVPGENAVLLPLSVPSSLRWLRFTVAGAHGFCISSAEIGQPSGRR
jgi:hypothetical protein